MKKPREQSTPGVGFLVVKGINYGDPERRVEPGEPLPEDFPVGEIGAMLEIGAIKPIEAGDTKEAE